MKKTICSAVLLVMVATAIAAIPNVTDAAGSGSVTHTWVRMRGLMTQWGTTPVFGWVNARAHFQDANGTAQEWVGVQAFWSNTPCGMNGTVPPTENFTYTFYNARLINESFAALDYNGLSFYVAGTWDVNNVTVTYYFDELGQLTGYDIAVEPILIGASGEFRVTNWQTFELAIDGIDLLSGNIAGYAVGTMEIKIGEMNGDGEIDIKDLAHVAKRYGSMPGLGNYDFSMDFNCDFRIDIGDLTTLAQNIKEPSL